MAETIKLPEIIYPKGTGIKDLSARLIKRDGLICMYERSDQIWEVFKVKIRRARTIKGVIFLDGKYTLKMKTLVKVLGASVI